MSAVRHEILTRTLFRLTVPIHAVRPNQDGTGGVIVEVPAGSILELHGDATIAGLVAVRYNGSSYAVFPQDLQDRAEPLAQHHPPSIVGLPRRQ